MKSKAVLLTPILSLLVVCYATTAICGSGTWSNPSGGSWMNSQNWLAGIIADGAGSLANFGTLGLSADATVTLDGARTLGSLNFDDQSAGKYNWILDAGTGGSLTLSGTSPAINVKSVVATVRAPISGSSGLTKGGSGKLLLSGANTYTGATSVSAGTLGLLTSVFSAASPLNIGAGALVESSGTLNLVVNSSGTAIAVSGAGTLRLAGTGGSASMPDIYFGTNHSANNFWGARLASALDLGNAQRYVFGKTGHNGIGVYGLTNADCQFAGPISGSGGLTLIAQNNWTGTGPMEVGFALNAANTFTGPIEIRRGSLYLGHPGALTNGNTFTMNPAVGHNARFFLYGNNARISDLNSSGAGTVVIANGSRKTDSAINLPGVTLTVVQNQELTFGGTITDAFSEYDSAGAGVTGPLSVLKLGPARLILAGSNDYSGTTTIAGGTLQMDGMIRGSAVSVQNGGCLTGTGLIAAATTVLPGGKLAPGQGVVAMTISNSVSLSGKVELEIGKSDGILSADTIRGITSLRYGGTLMLTNVGDEPFGPGDTFTLLAASSYSGAFENLVAPALPAGLVWDTSQLSVNGSVAVIDAASPPLITRQPDSQTVPQESTVTFTVSATGAPPLSYQWQKDSISINTATSSSFAISSATTNDSGGYRVIVSNANGSITSSVATLIVTIPPPRGPVTNGLIVYLNFDSNLSAQGGTSVNGSIYKGTPRYTPGLIGSAASFLNVSANAQPSDWAVSLGDLERVYSNNFTVSLWERNPGGADGALMGNKNWASGANVGWVISTLDGKNVNWNVAGGPRRDLGLNPPFSDNDWHLVTVSFNRSSNQVLAHVDGSLAVASDLNPNRLGSLNAGFNTLVGSSGNGLYSARGDIDDLGIWNRVLGTDEIRAIYNFGLIGKPLVSALPGDAPEITLQPADVDLALGGSANFTVTATGPGPLFYQWRFNGTNIAGATNASYSLSAANASNQGLYSVIVFNEYGGVASAGAMLNLYELQVTGQWDFSAGNLRATVGADLEYLGDTENLTTFPVVDLNGVPTRVMSFGSNSIAQGFLMRHRAKPNGGGQFVNQYTLIMDVMYPTPSNNQWRALFQSDPFNHDGNDADFYVSGSGAVPFPNGIGSEDQFDGQILPDTWYRLAFAVDLAAPDGQQLVKYLNGVEVGRQSLAGGVDGRHALGPIALLFTSGASSGGTTRPGFVSSIQFVNGRMSPSAIAALGGARADKLPPGNSVIRFAGIGQEGEKLTLNWTGPAGLFQVEAAASIVDPAWTPISPLTTNRSFVLQAVGGSAFYRVTQPEPEIVVGQLPFGEQSVPTKQILRAAGRRIQFSGRPVDLTLSPDQKVVYIKNLNSLVVVDAANWRILQTLTYPASGASMHGIALSPGGSRVYVTGSGNQLYEWQVGGNGVVSFSRTIAMPEGSDPCGVAISSDASKAYVCLGTKNRLAVVDLAAGIVLQQIPVGIAPWDVALSPDGNTAYVSDWGGRYPKPGEATASSAGTQVVIDSRGVAASGAVSVVDLASGAEAVQLATGLHPSDVELSPDGSLLFVANANSDTVTVIDTQARTIRETILVRPDPGFPYGSGSGGLAVSKDGKNLFVANAGNNAIAVVELPNAQHASSTVIGMLPTDWFPGAVVTDAENLYVVNVKGLGTRLGQPNTTKWQIGAHLGTANKIAIPGAESLSKFTAQSYELGRVPAIRDSQLPSRIGQAPVPVPLRRGEPSVFKHVVYILKENKTYDQVFGDLPQGNGDPSLCIYPRLVSPNHHALAEQYVLLDNFYCNGVNSADGHSWSTEANVTDHLEKSVGGYARSYTFGDDPLTYSSSGFIWNNVLEHGLTFRNYGEMDYASAVGNPSWLQIYRDFTNGTRSIKYVQNIGVASLRTYSSTNVPGWNLGIPDIVRADGFIRELNAAQARGTWETFQFLYLPNDHTGGPPSPRAQVADNDLALGQVIEAITRSIFGSNTVIFVIEDDPQSGYDHVDGHRSLCLVISPYTKRGQVISKFYNQPGVLHTMERIMGLPPMNQQDAMAPILFECFTDNPDYTPYTALPNNIDLAEGVSGAASLTPTQRYWAEKCRSLDLSAPDRIDDDTFNRHIWHSIKGDEPYPVAYVGAHGKGLKALGLKLAPEEERDGDGDKL